MQPINDLNLTPIKRSQFVFNNFLKTRYICWFILKGKDLFSYFWKDLKQVAQVQKRTNFESLFLLDKENNECVGSVLPNQLLFKPLL